MDFEKLPFVAMVEPYEIWVILIHVYWLFAEFHTIDSVLDDTWEQVLCYYQLFCLVFETKHFSLPILLFQFLTQHDPSLYSRFTNHCFNCSRWLLSFPSIEQILLNHTTCRYAIDLLHTLRWLDCAWKYWCVLFGLQYKSVSNLSVVAE